MLFVFTIRAEQLQSFALILEQFSKSDILRDYRS
jgi:hypothetical protein